MPIRRERFSRGVPACKQQPQLLCLLKTNASKFTRYLDPLYGDACIAKSFSTDCSPIDWLQSVGVINDNKFMKVRLLSRANSGGSSSRNGNCSSIPWWTYSGGTVPNPVLELGSHRIPNPGSGIQLLLSSCVKHTHLVCHTHTPLFVSDAC
jgi:hypothetical protein